MRKFVWFLCSIIWILIAAVYYTEGRMGFAILQIILAIGFFILGVVQLRKKN